MSEASVFSNYIGSSNKRYYLCVQTLPPLPVFEYCGCSSNTIAITLVLMVCSTDFCIWSNRHQLISQRKGYHFKSNCLLWTILIANMGQCKADGDKGQKNPHPKDHSKACYYKSSWEVTLSHVNYTLKDLS